MKRVYSIWLLSICILPFFQGGYFYHEALFFGAIQGLVLLILLLKKKITFKLTGFRWMYLVIIGGSLMSSFTAVDNGMHLVGILKLMIPFIFIINLDSFVNLYHEKVIQHLKMLYIFVATTMVSIILVVILFFDSSHFIFEYFVQVTRIGGFFQYANTFGMFIYGGLILLFVSGLSNKVKLPISILLVTGMMLTQSRGILLILVITLMLFAIFNSKRLRLTYILSFTGIAFGQWILWWIKDHVDVFRGVALLENRSEWLIRLLYYEDSLPMIMKRLTGYGHLGYYYTHQYYQTGASYKVKFLHNSLLQFSLDYGIIAGIALLLIGTYGCVIAMRGFKKNKFLNIRGEGIILLIGALGLFGHTLVDFDFQFMGFTILYFVILYLMEHKYRENVKEIRGTDLILYILSFLIKKKATISPKVVSLLEVIAISILVICISGCVYIGSVSILDYELESVKAYQMYPYFTDSIDHILKGKASNNSISDEEKLEIALDAVNRNSNYINGFAFLRDYYYNDGDLETAIKYAEKVYLLAPLRLDYYEIYTKIAIEQLLYLYLHENSSLSNNNEHLIALLNMEAYMLELENSRQNTYNVKHKVNFQLTEDMTKVLRKVQEISNTIQE